MLLIQANQLCTERLCQGSIHGIGTSKPLPCANRNGDIGLCAVQRPQRHQRGLLNPLCQCYSLLGMAHPAGQGAGHLHPGQLRQCDGLLELNQE